MLDSRRFGMGQCAVCEIPTRTGNLMCGPHWRKVPEPLKRDVHAALRDYRREVGTLGDLRAAQVAAVMAVA